MLLRCFCGLVCLVLFSPFLDQFGDCPFLKNHIDQINYLAKEEKSKSKRLIYTRFYFLGLKIRKTTYNNSTISKYKHVHSEWLYAHIHNQFHDDCWKKTLKCFVYTIIFQKHNLS